MVPLKRTGQSHQVDSQVKEEFARSERLRNSPIFAMRHRLKELERGALRVADQSKLTRTSKQKNIEMSAFIGLENK